MFMLISLPSDGSYGVVSETLVNTLESFMKLSAHAADDFDSWSSDISGELCEVQGHVQSQPEVNLDIGGHISESPGRSDVDGSMSSTDPEHEVGLITVSHCF